MTTAESIKRAAAPSGRSKTLTRAPAAPPSLRGGKRAGAGRKPLPGGRLTRCYALTQEHVDLLERYRHLHGLKSASDALRLLIEQALNY